MTNVVNSKSIHIIKSNKRETSNQSQVDDDNKIIGNRENSFNYRPSKLNGSQNMKINEEVSRNSNMSAGIVAEKSKKENTSHDDHLSRHKMTYLSSGNSSKKSNKF